MQEKEAVGAAEDVWFRKVSAVGRKAFPWLAQDLREMELTQICRQRKEGVGGLGQGWGQSLTMMQGTHRGIVQETGGQSGSSP